MGKPTKEEAAAALNQAAREDVRTRYSDVVKAAEKLRADGDNERADELMTAAGRILAADRTQAVAHSEADNYARSHAVIEPPKDDKAEE